jgi:hypothetical protein
MSDHTLGRFPILISIIVALALVSPVIPVISAAVPGVTSQVSPFITYPDLNVTNGSVTNLTPPSEYRMTPTLLQVQVELPDTALPAPKGEMAAGPRAIGFSTDPVSLAIVVLIVAALAAGTWYFLIRKRDEEDQK